MNNSIVAPCNAEQLTCEEWLSNVTVQLCVRLSEISNELETLEKEGKSLLNKLRKGDELIYYKYTSLSELDKQAFFHLTMR